MKLVFPLLPEPLCFEENRVNVLVIEEPFTLRKLLNELSDQIKGLAGNIVLSTDDIPRELCKLADLLIDPLHPEIESRKMAGRLLKAAVEIAQDHESELYAALAGSNEFAARICLNLGFPATFDPLEDPLEFLRLFDFRLDSEDLDTPELLLEWMLLEREYFGKDLFIFYGLKSFLNREELSAFYRGALYDKLNMLLIEPFQRGKPFEEECVTIIDEDLCVIC